MPAHPEPGLQGPVETKKGPKRMLCEPVEPPDSLTSAEFEILGDGIPPRPTNPKEWSEIPTAGKPLLDDWMGQIQGVVFAFVGQSFAFPAN